MTQDLHDVNQAVNTAKLDAAGETDGLRVLEPATSAEGPSPLSTAIAFLLAALVALAAGSAAALLEGSPRRPGPSSQGHRGGHRRTRARVTPGTTWL